MINPESVKSTVKAFILDEFLPGEDPDELTDATEMMTLGILESVSVMQLVVFLEEQFQVTLDANEMSSEHMNTLQDIADLVVSKCPN